MDKHEVGAKLRQHFGEELRQKRQELGYTQENLETVTGISQTSLSAYERGDRFPTPCNLQRLANALGTITLSIKPVPTT